MIDRLRKNVETGHFERMLSAATAGRLGWQNFAAIA